MQPQVTAARSSALSPEVTRTTLREVFASVYRDARSMRDVLANEFLTCGQFEIFVSDTRRLVVGRTGDYSGKPGFYLSCLGAAGTKSGRRYFLERSREHGPVPLPR